VAPSSLTKALYPQGRSLLAAPTGLALVAALLASLPVFLQAPWVRQSPFSAALFSLVLLALGLGLERWGGSDRCDQGALLVGFSGSWLGGALFWGWFRCHPLLHIPIEAFAMPLALGGLGMPRWRLAASFYLASLFGTACTDAAIASLGLMDFWPAALLAPLPQAAELLRKAGELVLQPLNIVVLTSYVLVLIIAARTVEPRGLAGQLAAATLLVTVAVDALFLLAALLAPRLSGLI
jgi:hypothetical protein